MCRACVGWMSLRDLETMTKSVNSDRFRYWKVMTVKCLLAAQKGKTFHETETDVTSKTSLATYLLDKYIEWKRNHPFPDDVDDPTTDNNYKGNPSLECIEKLKI